MSTMEEVLESWPEHEKGWTARAMTAYRQQVEVAPVTGPDVGQQLAKEIARTLRSRLNQRWPVSHQQGWHEAANDLEVFAPALIRTALEERTRQHGKDGLEKALANLRLCNRIEELEQKIKAITEPYGGEIVVGGMIELARDWMTRAEMAESEARQLREALQAIAHALKAEIGQTGNYWEARAFLDKHNKYHGNVDGLQVLLDVIDCVLAGGKL